MCINRQDAKGDIMVKIDLLEDESAQVKRFKTFLEKYREKHTEFSYTLNHYTRGIDILQGYSRDSDIVFLDIWLPDILGIEVAKKIRDIDSSVLIVFITNLTQYAIDGYSVNAFDYVLKPISYELFSAKLDRILRVLSYRESEVLIDVKYRDGGVRLSSNDISYIEVSNHDIQIHTGDRIIKQWGSLSKYETLLKDCHFVKCNSCYLVNLKYVKEVHGDLVTLENDSLTISKPKRKDFLNALAQYKGGSR